MRKMFALVVVACLMSAPSYAQRSGDTFLSACEGRGWNGKGKGGDAAVAMGHCYGYARGIADALMIWETLSPETAKACIPNNVTTQELVEATQKNRAGAVFDNDAATMVRQCLPCD